MKQSTAQQLWLYSAIMALNACGGGGTGITTPNERSLTETPQEPSQSLTQAEALRLANDEVATLAEFSGAPSGDATSIEGVIDTFNTSTMGAVGTLAVTTSTFFCSSPDPQNVDTGNGSVTITNDDQDPPGRSTGDTVTTAFAQCNQFGSIVNGSTSNKINLVTGEPFVTAPWVIDLTRTTDLSRTGTSRSSTNKSTSSSRSESTDGVVIVSTSTGQGTRSRTDAAGVKTDFTSQFSSKSTTDLNQQTKTSEFDMTSVEGTSTRTAKTATPIAGPLNGAPTSGVIEIKETDSAAGVNRLVRVTMQTDGTALVEIDSNGDGTVDQTFTAPWFGGIGFGGGFAGGAGSHVGPGFGGGTGGGGIAPPTSGQPPVGGPGSFPPPGGGGPISPVPPANPVPGSGTNPGFGSGFWRVRP